MNFRFIFRIFYTTVYTLLYIVLLALCIITPADTIRQALSNNQLYNVFVISGAVALTGLLAILIYASRLYTNRTVLAAIPKTWIPIEKGDVNKKVRKMIVSSLSRSAAIAWDSRPRADPELATIVSEPDARDAVARPPEPGEVKKKGRGFSRTRALTEKDEQTIAIPPNRPVWGEITHRGWSSPASPDLPNLQYITVIQELPHLIEAKAVSLAPPDPESNCDPAIPDIQVVELLQRPAAMGLRDYIGHLISVGIITSTDIATGFLAAYERARFSAQPLSEHEFRELMKQFAELLRCMNTLDSKELDSGPPESDIDDGSSSLTPVTPRSRSIASSSSRSIISRSGSEGTIRTVPSWRPGTKNTKRSEFGAAPATPKNKNRVVSRSPSSHSFAQSRRPYNNSSSSSSESLRSTSQGSVIKLNRTAEDGDLPYTLTLPEFDR